MCNHENREQAMTVLDEKTWCDPCLAPLVKALNDGGLRTIASCCGHEHGPGSVILDDDRVLIVLPDREWHEWLAARIYERTGPMPGTTTVQADRDADLSPPAYLADGLSREELIERAMDPEVLTAENEQRQRESAALRMDVEALIEASSLGTPEAKAARDRAPREVGAAIALAAKYLGRAKATEAALANLADRDAGQVRLVEQIVNVWSLCSWIPWPSLSDSTAKRMAELAVERALAARQSADTEALAKAWERGAYDGARFQKRLHEWASPMFVGTHPEPVPNPYRRTVTTGEWTEVGGDG